MIPTPAHAGTSRVAPVEVVMRTVLSAAISILEVTLMSLVMSMHFLDASLRATSRPERPVTTAVSRGL